MIDLLIVVSREGTLCGLIYAIRSICDNYAYDSQVFYLVVFKDLCILCSILVSLIKTCV